MINFILFINYYLFVTFPIIYIQILECLYTSDKYNLNTTTKIKNDISMPT